MAQCPHCKRKLHIWNIKAECPDCKTNISNYRWEERLEEDAYAREEAFFKMHTTLHKIKFAAVGNVLRIVRLVCSFLPIVAYLLPVLSFVDKLEDGSFSEPVSFSLLDIFISDSFNYDLGSLFLDFLSGPSNNSSWYQSLSLVLIFASLLFGVIAFFSIPLYTKKFKTPLQAILHFISLATFAAAPIVFALKGGFEFKIPIGIYVGIGLFALAFILDIAVAVKPLKKNDGRYIPKDDQLQREYAISIGAISEDE